MIKSIFTYTDEQWDEIKTVVRNRLGRDADQIERQITRTLGNLTGTSRCGPHRDCGERPHSRSALESQTPGHKARIKQLKKLRDRAEALRDDIIDALAPSFTIKRRRRSQYTA